MVVGCIQSKLKCNIRHREFFGNECVTGGGCEGGRGKERKVVDLGEVMAAFGDSTDYRQFR